MATKSNIQDQTFLFTGKLTEFTRDIAEAIVEANGGKVLSGVSAKLNYLVVGEDAGSKLEKAKALGSVKILTQKEFMSFILDVNSEETDTSVSVSVNNTQDKNEILLDLKFSELKTLMSKYLMNSFTDKILTISESIQSFADITSDDKSFFYYSEANGKLIMNYLLEEVENEMSLNQDIFKELAKHSKSDFKIVFLDCKFWELSFCAFTNGETKFEKSTISDWENPYYFDDVPYFVKLAKDKGMKMIKDEDGDKVWDGDEVYDLIYEFRDNLIYGDIYLNLAPDWYKEIKTIAN
jgi:hypothetical protein